MSCSLPELLMEAGVAFAQGVSMAAKTTLKVGGPAAFFVEAATADDIALAMGAAREAGMPVYVIGNGSNLLVRDGGLDGLVVSIGPAMADISIEETRIRAGAGAKLSQVAQAAQAAGLTGMEALSGVPGTIGGALCMNAGCYGTEMAQLVISAEVLDEAGRRHTLAAADLDFGYRHSALMDKGWIATGVTLQLSAGDPEAITAEMRRLAKERRSKQPLNLPSAGSFFKRPEGQFAGALIEQAGMKGATLGGAKVSELHAGFLVNTGGATAQDFLDLMRLVQAMVFSESGVMLEAEVQILGCDLSC